MVMLYKLRWMSLIINLIRQLILIVNLLEVKIFQSVSCCGEHAALNGAKSVSAQG